MSKTMTETADEPRIRKLLRCRRTRRYFTGDGWTKDPLRARCFAQQIDAILAAIKNDLRDVEIVLRLRGSESDFLCARIW